MKFYLGDVKQNGDSILLRRFPGIAGWTTRMSLYEMLLPTGDAPTRPSADLPKSETAFYRDVSRE